MPLSLRMREILGDLKLLSESRLGMNLAEEEIDYHRQVFYRLKDEFVTLCKEEEAQRTITNAANKKPDNTRYGT